ncbi:Sjogren's syndrome/scleroderma autoantigen 1 family protein [Haloferax chudinovii]|uniref:Sjogren's syndrome/scleroderma autoantigen 1 family protein n=1 Tax=Haloferax chudinovii TaxID=1109010 RepID=A0ABD5XGW6_9EURY
MSDFDKEAERQRLREKYERDETKRRSTQRMSELLLKGATMTDKHCDNCGDPLFRYEGQVFCPTCQAEGQAAANADQDAERADEAAVEADANEGEGEAASGGATASAESVDAADAESVGAEATETERPQIGTQQPERAGRNRVADEARRDTAGSNGRAASATRSRTTGGRGTTEGRATREVAGDVTAARESLVRTLTWAAERAESTDDPRRATEFLTAAREAAEAISALDR